MALHAETLAPAVFGFRECRFGVTHPGAKNANAISARAVEQQNVVPRCLLPIGNGRQLVDPQVDQCKGVLRDSRFFRDYQRDWLADITDLLERDHGLPVRLTFRHAVLPNRDVRYRRADFH